MQRVASAASLRLARSAKRARHNLPAQRTALIGREREVVRVRDLLPGSTGRLVTLTGAGGCGKTRLALAVAAEIADKVYDSLRADGLGKAVAFHTRCLEQANTLGTTLLTSFSQYGLGRVAHVQGDIEHSRRSSRRRS